MMLRKLLLAQCVHILANNDVKIHFRGEMAPQPSFQPLNTWTGPKTPNLISFGQMRKHEAQSCSRYRIKLELELGIEYQLQTSSNVSQLFWNMQSHWMDLTVGSGHVSGSQVREKESLK